MIGDEEGRVVYTHNKYFEAKIRKDTRIQEYKNTRIYEGKLVFILERFAQAHSAARARLTIPPPFLFT